MIISLAPSLGWGFSFFADCSARAIDNRLTAVLRQAGAIARSESLTRIFLREAPEIKKPGAAFWKNQVPDIEAISAPTARLRRVFRQVQFAYEQIRRPHRAREELVAAAP